MPATLPGVPIRKRNLTTFTATSVCALALSACGSDPGPPKPATPAQRAAYIAKGDAVCAAYNTLARQLRRQLTQRRAQVIADLSLKPYAAPLSIARDGAKAAIVQFKAIDVPAGDEARIRTLTDAMTQQQQLLAKLTSATDANNAAGFKPLNDRLVSAGADERRLAAAYGFKQCGRRS